MPGYVSEADSNSDSGSSGGVWESLINAGASLGTVAINAAYAPQNAGLATNPQGEAIRPGILPASSGSSFTSILLLAGVVLLGFWAFKKM